MKTKLKRIEVPTEKGSKFMMFVPILGDNIDACCISSCPYNSVCGNLPDPRDLKNEDKAFTDFCSSVVCKTEYELEGISEDGDDTPENGSEVCLIPQKGSIEKLFMEIGKEDLIQTLLKKDPLVKISEVVDSVCPGWCDMYNEEHTNCKCDNSMCILKTIFAKKKV